MNSKTLSTTGGTGAGRLVGEANCTDAVPVLVSLASLEATLFAQCMFMITTFVLIFSTMYPIYTYLSLTLSYRS